MECGLPPSPWLQQIAVSFPQRKISKKKGLSSGRILIHIMLMASPIYWPVTEDGTASFSNLWVKWVYYLPCSVIYMCRIFWIQAIPNDTVITSRSNERNFRSIVIFIDPSHPTWYLFVHSFHTICNWAKEQDNINFTWSFTLEFQTYMTFLIPSRDIKFQINSLRIDALATQKQLPYSYHSYLLSILFILFVRNFTY